MAGNNINIPIAAVPDQWRVDVTNSLNHHGAQLNDIRQQLQQQQQQMQQLNQQMQQVNGTLNGIHQFLAQAVVAGNVLNTVEERNVSRKTYNEQAFRTEGHHHVASCKKRETCLQHEQLNY